MSDFITFLQYIESEKLTTAPNRGFLMEQNHE